MKTWTNNPEWQNQDTGETTELGAEHRYKAQMRLYKEGKGPNPETLNLKETDMSKFAKKDKAADDAAPKTKVTTKVNTDALTRPKADKPAKGAKAGKAAKEETASNDDRKITLLTKENPKREGSAAHERFELYRKSKTVTQFLEAGGSSADLRYDEKAGHIKVA